MNFYDFVCSIEKQNNPIQNELLTLIKNDAEFPKTDKIDVMAKYIYLKLSSIHTRSYQSLLIFWLMKAKGISQPDPTTLNLVNLVVELQNNDPNYPF
jgi:hypothetical protein